MQSIVEKRAVQAQVRNASGQPVRDESGTFVLTPWGQAYAEREHFLNHRGISDHVLRDQLAAEYADKVVAGKPVLPTTPGATRAKTVTGGAVRGSQKVNSGTLAQKIMNENTHIGDEDHIEAIIFTD